ncbi:hypothetical protein DFA_10355 [Cavenderia fasciculata]|uniref:TAP42 family protein n=1 Tax=Cavenderia fasciculata TaxID=261658 RepID=F4Q9Z4_CACFS|nr:uncharacterized protein DFA_10355 [Cavenderia fasciculata]EGG15513.1 hypothetical protein DFA_10355 [Cavenderia fasciculata]|eukprot:XP_004354255.1 hypothetical protein DFA_10355 [Cavenderia fasciculata]
MGYRAFLINEYLTTKIHNTCAATIHERHNANFVEKVPHKKDLQDPKIKLELSTDNVHQQVAPFSNIDDNKVISLKSTLPNCNECGKHPYPCQCFPEDVLAKDYKDTLETFDKLKTNSPSKANPIKKPIVSSTTTTTTTSSSSSTSSTTTTSSSSSTSTTTSSTTPTDCATLFRPVIMNLASLLATKRQWSFLANKISHVISNGNGCIAQYANHGLTETPAQQRTFCCLEFANSSRDIDPGFMDLYLFKVKVFHITLIPPQKKMSVSYMADRMSDNNNDHDGLEKTSTTKVLESSTTSTATSSTNIRDLSLYQLFTFGQKTWNELQNSVVSSSDEDYQQQVKRAIQYFMMASFQFDKQAMISKNEELDDIRTDILKYLLIPYYLGDLYVALVDKENRLRNLKNAKNKIISFINRCEMIGLVHKDDMEIISRDGKPNPANRRNELISRGKRDKEVREQLSHVLKKRMEMIKKLGGSNEDGALQEENDCGDEEVERSFSLLLLREAISKSISMFEMFDLEVTMLQEVAALKEKHGGVLPATPPPKSSGIGNFQILPDGRRVMLDKVFRPSHILPTMTPEEAVEIEMRNGGMVKGKGGKESEKKSDDEEEVDGKEEDHEKLKKKRDWDDWKDDNPKGAGNTLG